MSAQAAKDYFDESLNVEDYYTEGREITGEWHGQGAERLGLCGEVKREDFHALCDNRTPDGEKLTARDNPNRRVGFDITFNVPKSVSLHYSMTGNTEILEAFQDSYRETMAELEQEAMVRVRKGEAHGTDERRQSGNIVYADFVHFTARPVEGLCDPHLHAHCFVQNVSFDPVEGKNKALDATAIHEKMPYFEGAAASRFAEKLHKLGYETIQTETGWELKGYDRAPELLEKFSQRGNQVKQRAEHLGITDPDAIANLARTTREGKQGEQTVESQRESWQGRMTAEELALVAKVERDRGGESGVPVTAAGAMDYALGHHLGRASVVNEHKLKATALIRGIGDVSVDEINAEFEARKEAGEVLSGTDDRSHLITTREILQEEEKIVDFACLGKGQAAPLSHLRVTEIEGRRSEEQATAINQILGSRDRVTLLNGKAGVGKTTAMRDAIEQIERGGGSQVHTFAPTTKAVRMLNEDGLETQTVAHLLTNEKLQEELSGQTIWIDEAGMVGTQDMARVVDLAEKQNARLVLSGDVNQHSSVPRGDAMRILEESARLPVASLEQIHRQEKQWYRDVVADASKGDTATAFRKLDERGYVIQTDDQVQAAVDGYLKTTLDDHRQAMVIAPTHREGDQVNAGIREGLREAGMIAEEETALPRLESLQMTEADKGVPLFYQPGQVVKTHDRISGLQPGRGYEVSHVEDGRVFLHGSKNDPFKELPLDQAEKFEVYEQREIGLSAGDRIRITRNGKVRHQGRELKLENGTEYQVDEITPNGDLLLTNGAILPQEFGHIRHAYVSTSYAAQGSKAEHVYVCQGSGTLANNAEQFYVSISRGQQSVTIFTDDKERLSAEVRRSSDRLSATELTADQDDYGPEPDLDLPEWTAHLDQVAELRGDAMHREALEAEFNREQAHGPEI